MKRNRLDIKDKMPTGMEEYLALNGWHFNKKLCIWAIKNMRSVTLGTPDHKVPITPKEEIQQLFERHHITVENCVGYDVMFVFHMAKSDYWNSSITDELQLLQYVKDYIDDCDGYDGLPMTRFYADCIGSGTPIMWEDMI